MGREASPTVTVAVASTPRGLVGALHETTVAALLLQHGYYVFRAMSAHGPCDLVAIREDEIVRIEVTTGTITETGDVLHPAKADGRHRYDLVAIVVRDGQVFWARQHSVSRLRKQDDQQFCGCPLYGPAVDRYWITKACRQCGTEFSTVKDGKFCSAVCRARAGRSSQTSTRSHC